MSGVVGVALLFQESVLAFQFGVSEALAAYQIAFLWVSLLWNVLAGGTLLAVLIPTYVWARANLGLEGASTAFETLSGWLLAFSIIVSVGLALTVPMLYKSPVSGLATAEATLAAGLFAAMAPTFVLQTLSAIAQARLNVDGRFALAALTPALSPLAAAAATLAFAENAGVLAPACGVVIGQVLQAIALILALPRQHRLCLRLIYTPAGLARLLASFRSYGLLVVAALLLSGVFWVDQATAAHLGAESVARLAYANRPVLLFSAFATVAIANVSLPAFTEHAARGNFVRLTTQLRHITLWLVGVSAIALPLWGLMAPEIVSILYQRGAFLAAETTRVADIQRWAIVQIPFYLLGVLAWRMLNALRENGAILAGTAACFLLNLALAPWLARIGGERGILAATGVAFAVWAVMLNIVLRRRLKCRALGADMSALRNLPER